MNQFFSLSWLIENFADYIKVYIASKIEKLENLYSREVQDQTKAY